MKTTPLLLCFLLLPLLCLRAQDAPKVVATAGMIADMAENIFGEQAEVQSLVPTGGDPHLFEPTPASARMVNAADLVLMNGLTFEGWLTKLVENSGTQAEVVRVTEGITPIASLDHNATPDPHAWMDARLGIRYAQNIKEAAQRLMPEKAEWFERRFQNYKKTLEDTDAYIRRQIEKIPERQRILVTSHDAFQYYGRAYGLQLEATMGTSTDAEVKSSDMVRLQRLIRESAVPAVFTESTINPKLMQQLSKDNHIRIGGKLYADSLGPEGSGAETYVKMLRKNTDTIVEALRQGPSEAQTETPPLFDSGTIMLLGGIALLLILFLLLRAKTK